MKTDQEAGLLYVFYGYDDPWLDKLQDIFCRVFGWCEDEYIAEWTNEETGYPSMFAQLFTVYRFRGLSVGEAVDEFVRHPDYNYLAETWRDTHVDDR